MSNFVDFIEILGEGFHNGELASQLQKLDPDESGSLESFAFVRWYMDEDVSLESVEEAEHLVAWGYNISLMDLQQAIFLKVH